MGGLIKIYSLEELIELARIQSPFYKRLYTNLPPQPTLKDLPILESQAFWTANGFQNNEILTSSDLEGVVFKSGGTSGQPKFSYFTKEEWTSFTQAFGEGMTRGGLQDGERIANLFYVGDLYASFLFIKDSLEASPRKILQFPLGGSAEPEHILETLKNFKIGTWAGVPTHLMKLAELVHEQGAPAPQKILFGGESFYPDQRNHLLQLFPGVRIQSIGYASVDGGLLGYVDPSCQNEEHLVFSKYTIMEIIDEESGLPITEPHQAGRLLLTNLTRSLMPILRYPVGDRAEWIFPPGKSSEPRFKILGRSEEGARIGPATIYYEDVAALLISFQAQTQTSGFQLLIRHFDKKDELTLRISSPLHQNRQTTSSTVDPLALAIKDALESERPLFRTLKEQGVIHPLVIEFVSPQALLCQARTGKLKRIIDERFGV